MCVWQVLCNADWTMISAVATVIGAIAAVVATVGVLFAFRQLQVSKKAAVFEIMAELDREFNSGRILKLRERTVNLDFANFDEPVQCEDLLDFFEKIGFLENDGVILLDPIYEMWGYWIERYWVLCEKQVYKRRKEPGDGTYYDKLEILFNKLAKLSLQKMQKAKASIDPKMANKEIEAYKDKIKKELKEFKEEERNSDINENGNNK
jgi:hypothetical protein